MVKVAANNIPLSQLFPKPGERVRVNCCGNPDCTNFGVSPDFSRDPIVGRNAPARREAERRASNAFAAGLGAYTSSGASTSAEDQRTTRAFEYANDPITWSDQRTVRCQAALSNGPCNSGFTVLNDQCLEEELDRLVSQNGVLDGPACGACGRRYLDALDEFVLNGRHQKVVKPAKHDGEGSSSSNTECTNARGQTNQPKKQTFGLRVIHRPCRGKPGARFTVSLPHERQRRSFDNLLILRLIMNSAGILDICRAVGGQGSNSRCGVARVYDRIYWLEATLLAYERAQLDRWRERVNASGERPARRISHDDIVLGVNWQSDTDRRITPLNVSVSADADSGYVFRADADFDPRVDPVSLFNKLYLDKNGQPINLRGDYTYKTGETFTAPLFHFQRSSGRLDEHAFFAACLNQIGVFRETKLRRMVGSSKGAKKQARADLDAQLAADMALIEKIYYEWFDLKKIERTFRASFSGVTVRQIYAKGAHLMALRDMLPPGDVCLITEQEGTLTRLVPHVFCDAITADAFTWLVVGFDKTAIKPVIETRTKEFRKELKEYRDVCVKAGVYDADEPHKRVLRDFVADRMEAVVGRDRLGAPTRFPLTIFHGGTFPQVWVRSPVQSSGETNKTVGFPILNREARQMLKGRCFDDPIPERELRERLAPEVLRATLQPASTFMNALRQRLSPAARAGTGGARSGGSYVQGAVFNPRVLIALVNIHRIHYNFFETRPYVEASKLDRELERVSAGASNVRVPGSDNTIAVHKRRRRRPRMLTPAMRLGVQEIPAEGETWAASNLTRVLHRPWLLHETPLWDKFEDKHLDKRLAAPVAAARATRRCRSPKAS